MSEETRPCESCGAALPVTGTYCLACDTPVAGLREGRLSVAETHAVRRGRPIMGIALVAGCVLALAGVTVALVLAIRPQPAVKARPHRVHHSARQDQPASGAAPGSAAIAVS